MTWYGKAIKDNKKELISSAILAVIFALALLLWNYFTGKGFGWKTTSPVEEPGLLPRIVYSALVFMSLGALLYSMKFYKVLYSFYRGKPGGYREYKKDKKSIWGLLILIMYFVIIPFVVKLLNVTISFFYNVFNLILYLLPPLGITLILFGGGYLLYLNSERVKVIK